MLSSPSTLGPFELFKIQPRYFIDLDQVKKTFYELSRTLHPDKFQSKPAAELAEATRAFARLNESLSTLQDSERRALCLFELAGFDKNKNKENTPPDLAQNYFELQESIEEEPSREQELVAEFAEKLAERERALEIKISGVFKDWESAGAKLDPSAHPFFETVAKLLKESSYVHSMRADLEKKWPA